MIRFVFLAVLAFLALGLTSCGEKKQVPPAVSIRVERLATGDAFHVTWRSEQPTRALVFSRGLGLREGRWKPVGSGLKFVSRGGYDILESELDRIEFGAVIPERTSEVIGDYPFLTTFSDGGLVLYTGHLDAASIHCLNLCSPAEIEVARGGFNKTALQLIPRNSELIVTEAGVARQQLLFHPPPGGALVYFGRQEVSQANGFSVIADPRLPRWLERETKRLLPKILNLNAAKLGRRPHEPLVFIPYMNEENSRFSMRHSGSVVGNHVLLSLYGASWERRGPGTLDQYRKLLAHEAFHLWNANLFHNSHRTGTRWLHEGSADEFSILALAELGLLSSRELRQLRTEALNRCLIGLTGATIPESDYAAHIRNHYDCGSVVQSLLGYQLERQGSDLWTFWSSLFDVAGKNNRFYNPETFYSLANGQTSAPKLVDSLEALTQGKVGGPEGETDALEELFFSSFRTVGIDITATDDGDWPEWYRELVLERALSMALMADCGSAGYYVSDENSIRIVGRPSCRYLKSDQDITTIAGRDFRLEAVQVYDSIRSSCADEPSFEIAGPSLHAPLTLACPTLPRRPRYMSIAD